MGKRSDMRLPQGKDVCKKKTRVAGNRLREGPGFCCGNTNKHATFHTFFQVVFEESVESFERVILRKYNFSPFLFKVATSFAEDPGRPVILFG